MEKRLIVALVAYGILMGIACVLLSGRILMAVVILFAGLTAKSLIAWRAGW